MAKTTEPAEIAHLLKRTGFGVTPARVRELVSMGWDEAIKIVVDGTQPPGVPSKIAFKNVYQKSEYDDFLLLLKLELQRLDAHGVGLGDRMLWFWHGLLTSGFSKVELPSLILRQHQLIAQHALGNFHSLLNDITTDAAMLIYLDGNGSTAAAPNENYARELMELFSLGRGKYQQADVTEAARALSGWYVEGFPEREKQHFKPEKIRSNFNSEAASTESVTFLGEQTKPDAASVVERILEQEACGDYIGKKLFQYFVHPEPDATTVSYLGAVFRRHDYEIRPLLSALFRHPDFRSPKSRSARARLPLELLLATTQAFSLPVASIDYASYFYSTGQMPFDPPNVAGWPPGPRWLSSSQSLARTRLALNAFTLPGANEALLAVTRAANPVEESLARTALYEVSTQTRKELSRIASLVTDAEMRARALLSLAVASPEFALT